MTSPHNYLLQITLGNFGLSADQERVQMGLWSMFASPLLMSVNLRTVPPRSKALLLNPRVLAINQDKMALQARRVINVSGALDGGSKCRMSILRNSNIACSCYLFYPMSYVEFKNTLCHMSLYFFATFACHQALCRMSNLRNAHVALSILGVKGHVSAAACI